MGYNGPGEFIPIEIYKKQMDVNFSAMSASRKADAPRAARLQDHKKAGPHGLLSRDGRRRADARAAFAHGVHGLEVRGRGVCENSEWKCS